MRVPAAGQLAAQLVQEVVTLVRDLEVHSCHIASLLASVVASFLFSGQLPLFLGETLLAFPQELGRIYNQAVAAHHEVAQS